MMEELLSKTEWRKWIEHVEGWSDHQVAQYLKRVKKEIKTFQRVADHLRDVQRRRRRARPRISSLAKLPPSNVPEIRRLRREGFTQEWLARKFAVSQGTIHNLLTGKTYRHI